MVSAPIDVARDAPDPVAVVSPSPLAHVRGEATSRR